MSQIIDWDVAARVGVALLRPGPTLTARERAASVTRLRAAAGRAAELVAEASRLPAAEAATHGTTLVVDRAGVVRVNAAAMAMVLDGLTDDETSRLKALLQSAGAKVTGTGAGLVMAVIGGAILGQYEPFSNRLLLSAPSIEAVRAEIGASPEDFALWVCLHEQTHRHQFAAAPWMRDYMRELVRSTVSRDDELTRGTGDHPVGFAATPPKEGNFSGGSFPSLGGVAGPKGLTGWSVTFPHTLKKTTPALRATPPKEGNGGLGQKFPSLGGVAGPKGLTGWSLLPCTRSEDHPGGFAATPPKEGNFADDGLKAVIGQITALMSLLEGYADMLMDTSGAAVIPSLPTIRAQVDQRRRVKKYDLASLLRRAFGFEAKIDQYVVGKSFCETVRQKVGMDGLNLAFTSRDTLPTVDELHHPDDWLARCQPPALAG